MQMDAVVAAVTLGIHTINGYSGNFPPSWKGPMSCSDLGADIRAGTHFLSEHGQPPAAVTPYQLVLVGFEDCNMENQLRDPELSFDRTYGFDQNGDGNPLMGGGFSGPEPWGRWTDADDSYLYFSLPSASPDPITITMDAMSFSAAPDRRQDIAIDANGRDCGVVVIATGRQRGQVICPAGSFQDGSNILRLHVASPARPVDLHVNQDSRRLGLG